MSGIAPLLRDLGCSPATVGDRCGVDLDALVPDTRLPLATAVQLLETAARASGCPHLGLLLGARARPDVLGIINRLARHAPTLRQALLDHITWQLGYSTGAITYLNRVGEDYAFGYGIFDRHSYGSAQLYDLVAAFGYGFLRELTAGRVEPIEVLLCRRCPEDPRPYQQVFRVPVRFNENQFCLVLPGHSLDLPIPGADPEKRASLLREIEAQHARVDNSFVIKLRRIVRPLLLEGSPSMVDAADALGIPVRTLRRRLAAADQTFEAIRDEVRYTLARDLLMLTDLPVSDVAEALAFATHSAFTNAFQRWSGQTPTAWRAEASASAQGGAYLEPRADGSADPARVSAQTLSGSAVA